MLEGENTPADGETTPAGETKTPDRFLQMTVAELFGGPVMLPAYHAPGLTPLEREARDTKNRLLNEGLWWD